MLHTDGAFRIGAPSNGPTMSERATYTDSELREVIEACAYWALSEGALNSRAELDEIMAALDALIERAKPTEPDLTPEQRAEYVRYLSEPFPSETVERWKTER